MTDSQSKISHNPAVTGNNFQGLTLEIPSQQLNLPAHRSRLLSNI
jgi:hypothetical protein